MDAFSQRQTAYMATNSDRTRAWLPGSSGRNRGLPDKQRSATGAVRLNPDFKLMRNGYEIRIANGLEALKRNTARLIERMYSSRGLFPYGQGESLDERNITVVACKGDCAVATLTLCLDVGAGLLADTLYRDEINAARIAGSRVCEITRLAMATVSPFFSLNLNSSVLPFSSLSVRRCMFSIFAYILSAIFLNLLISDILFKISFSHFLSSFPSQIQYAGI